MSWSKFEPMGPVQVASKYDGVWHHNLVAPLDEPDPRNNHVHFKYRSRQDDGTAELVNCSLKLEGRHAISRRTLITALNQAAGLNIPLT
jgi:hypothetical protein